MTGTVTTASKLNHYGDDSDEPRWITEDVAAGDVTRNVSGPEGDLVATTSATGDVRLQLVNLHGDVAATIDTALVEPEFFDFDEFGSASSGQADQRYGWLGGKQRSSDALGAVILMGVRLYSPGLGRFLQVDPVAGGNANDYDYCSGDPINCFDLDGRWGWKRSWKRVGNWWNKHGGKVSAGLAIAGFAACAVATAGACVAVGAVAAGISVAGRYGMYQAGRSTRRQAIVGSALDIGQALLPGARLTRRVKIPKTFRKTRYVRSWGVTRIKWRGSKIKNRSYSWRESYYRNPRRTIRNTWIQFGSAQFSNWRGTRGY
ncbi:RHS repeat-associated core domain-containing protein [Micromonospora sp. NBC_00617]|uniref:RHS repeat-associated core domain-containing protein n=1 Tax=Micromonospora sp. NBC_00617 TaxID=2903587 RepID=UPI0030E21205